MLLKLFQTCKKSTVLFGSSIGQEALISGTSDVIVIKYPNGTYKSTPFVVCFGSHAILNRSIQIQIQINQNHNLKTKNYVSRHGYMENLFMTQQQIESMKLNYGKNKILYKIQNFSIEADIWLIKITDKILISDFDGTLTINDFGGLIGGILDYQFVQPGYKQLMQKLYQKGVVLIWVTMRSLPFYNVSKRYLSKYLQVQGVMLMQPEQFLPAVKKQLFKKTGNIKANIIRSISQLFPKQVNPFVGGLGNRQGDAIAYLCVGIISSKTNVQRMNSKHFGLNYSQMAKNVDQYFRLDTYFC